MTQAARRAARRERRILSTVLQQAADPWADVPAASAIVPGLLWQGKPPVDHAQLAALGVRCVVTCCLALEPGGCYPAPEGVELVRFPIDDGRVVPDLEALARVVGLVVDRVGAGVPTYVHCTQGLNRSGLVVALALRVLTGLDGGRVIAALRALRHRDVLCNAVFNRFVCEATVTTAAAA